MSRRVDLDSLERDAMEVRRALIHQRDVAHLCSFTMAVPRTFVERARALADDLDELWEQLDAKARRIAKRRAK